MPILARAGAAAARGFGMLGKIAAAVDEYFKYVTLLLPGNGTNGAQNNTFLDSSTNNFTITRNGNTTQGTFSPYGTLWSNYFDGTSDYLGVPDSTAFDFGSGNFTIECWAFTETFASAYNVLVCQWNSSNAWIFRITSGAIGLYANIGGTQDYTASVTNSVGTWDHFAVVRNGTTLTFFKNGTSVGTATISGTIADSTNQVTVGILGDGNNVTAHKGYISNLRIVKGTAVYTGAFTPSTSPLTAITNTSLLTCQSNRFIDNSANAFSITVNGNTSIQRFSPFAPTAPYAASTDGGSGYFDASGDYLAIASGSTAVAIGTGDFTIECWYYPAAAVSSDVATLFSSTQSDSGSTIGLNLNVFDDRKVYIRGSFPTSNTVTVGAWNHIVASRVSGTTRIFINGVLGSSNSDSNNYVTNGCFIGARNIGSIYAVVNGYICDMKVTRGSGVTSVTVPTTPATNSGSPAVLCNFTNAGIIDNAEMNNLETVGNAQISTAQSKFGGGSMAFDGTGDWLTAPNSKGLYIGSGNFTIEGWLYLNATGATKGIVSQFNSNGTGPGWTLYIKTTNVLEFYGGSGTVTVTGTAAIAATTWTHFAVVRSGSTITIYVNGTAGGTATNSSFSDDTSALVYVGGRADSASLALNGYIDDLRITKGYARYTSSFTAPTAPFPLS